MTAASVGSSPRVRGKPISEIRDEVRSRLIPARAGKTARPAPVAGARVGSSPRVRGKLGQRREGTPL